MSMTDCPCCGQMADGRNMSNCTKCGAALCADCDREGHGLCRDCRGETE